MLREVIAALLTDRAGRYVDGTVGEGGHARGILEALGPDGRLLGLDRDPTAIAAAREALASFGDRVQVQQARFSQLAELLPTLGWPEVDGILLDLGLRSNALDDPSRGFSFQADGPLDMRFDPTGRAILEARRRGVLQRTGDLVAGLRAALGRRATPKLLSSVFATLRMAVNEELEELDRALATMPALLKTGGVLCVLAYQSQEDRRVKGLSKTPCVAPAMGRPFRMAPLWKGPLRPSAAETARNPRGRSAHLRAFRRLPPTEGI